MSADKYFNLHLKDADYVFNAKETNPAIQFQYQINYGFVKRDREKEKEEKERRMRSWDIIACCECLG